MSDDNRHWTEIRNERTLEEREATELRIDAAAMRAGEHRFADGRSGYSERFFAEQFSEPYDYYDADWRAAHGEDVPVWLSTGQAAHLRNLADRYDSAPIALLRTWILDSMEKWTPSGFGEVPDDGADFDPAGMSEAGRRLHARIQASITRPNRNGEKP